jgi:antitoxin CptB
MTAPPGHLSWRCRRGMKELDLVLKGWLEQRYARATPDERALFARFLELPDPEIAGFLFGHAIPADPAMGALVAQLSPRRA